MKMRYLTINTDASFCPHTKAGGYAFWVKCDRFTLKKAYFFKVDADNPTDAELKSIANAICLLLQSEKLLQVDVIVINTDCKPAINHIKTPNKEITLFINDKLKSLQQKVGANKIQFKHVKAHSGVDDSRSWVNEWCDENAKKWMRKQRKQKYLIGGK